MIDNKDVATVEQLTPRKQLTHQLFDVVTGQVESKHEAQFETLVSLLRKIEVWWVVNVEIATNPDFDEQDTVE